MLGRIEADAYGRRLEEAQGALGRQEQEGRARPVGLAQKSLEPAEEGNDVAGAQLLQEVLHVSDEEVQ